MNPTTVSIFYRLTAMVVTIFSVLTPHVQAQNVIDNQQHVWFNFSEKITLNEKQSISGLYSLRRNEYLQNWQQSLLRVNFNHVVSKTFTATLGYDYAVNFPYGEQPLPQRFNEHRSVQQFTIKNNIRQWEVKHRYRVEQRFMFLPSDLAIRHRFRYRFVVSKPIVVKKQTTRLTFVAFDELFVNVQRADPSHYFDQNWVYGGFNYKLTDNLSVDLGYMNQYLVKPDGIQTESNHTIMIGVKHKIEQSDL